MISNKGNFRNFYPYQFDWGNITAEGYNSEINEVILVFNCDLRAEVNISNAVQFVIGRICYGAINFPQNAAIRITFDVRGQEIIMSRTKIVKEQLLNKVQKIGVDNNLMIEFLR